uniref:Uncharacterized protein n=1 Tax=Trichobilharzia regenti TaxID=157069 RepID=A0AA85JYU9_TRIRE|nr:unnamed protein product [Trichobilharzia regenti]
MISEVIFENKFAERLLAVDGFHCGVLIGGCLGSQECLFLPVEIPSNEVQENQKSSVSFNKVEDIKEKWVGSHCRNLARMIPGGVRISGICLTLPHSEFTGHIEHIKKILSYMSRDETLTSKYISPDNREKIVLVVDSTTKKFLCKAVAADGSNSHLRTLDVKIRPVFDRWVAFKTNILLSLETHLPSDRKKEKISHQLQAAVDPYLQSLVTETQLLINGELRQLDEKLLKDSDLHLPVDDDFQTKKNKRKSKSKRYDISLGDVNHSTNSETESKKYIISKDLVSPAFTPLDIVIFGPQACILKIRGEAFPHWQRASSSSSLESGASSDTNMNNGNDTSGSSSSFVSINRLLISGRIPGIAFLPVNSNVGDLLEALRKDLIRSVLVRLQLLTEELHITSAELEVPRMMLPQRVLVRLPPCPTLPLSDYKFLSETPEDVVNRLVYFCSPLGTTVSSDSVNLGISHSASDNSLTDVESTPQIPSSDDRIDASCLDTTLEKTPEINAEDDFSESELLDEVVESVPNRSSLLISSPIIVITSIMALVIAILLAYYIFTQSHATKASSDPSTSSSSLSSLSKEM